MHDRTRTPVVCPQRGARPQQFIIGDDETESELSLGSRSFLNRVNDQVRRRQKRSSMNVTERQRQTFCDMENVHVCNIAISCIHGKELPRQLASIKNTKDLTMKQMFDVSAKLVSEQDEIHGVKTIDWENYSWKYLSLIGDEQIIILQRTEVYVFSDPVPCLGEMNEKPPNQTLHGNKDWSGSKLHRNTETWTELMVSQWNSSGISSQDSIRCSSVKKFKSYCWDQMKHQRILQEGSSSCRCSTTSHGDPKTPR